MESHTNRLRLLLGENHHPTSLPWECLDAIPAFLHHRDWVRIGGTRGGHVHKGSLAQHLFLFNMTDTAGYVAVILERAGVVEIDRGRPNRVRLRKEWAPE